MYFLAYSADFAVHFRVFQGVVVRNPLSVLLQVVSPLHVLQRRGARGTRFRQGLDHFPGALPPSVGRPRVWAAGTASGPPLCHGIFNLLVTESARAHSYIFSN